MSNTAKTVFACAIAIIMFIGGFFVMQVKHEQTMPKPVQVNERKIDTNVSIQTGQQR